MFSSVLASEMKNFQHYLSRFQALVAGLAGPDHNITCGVLHNFVGPIAGHEVGLRFKSIDQLPKTTKLILNFGNDNRTFLHSLKTHLNRNCKVVYLGTNGDEGANAADMPFRLGFAGGSQQLL